MNALEELRQMADLQECGKAFIEVGQLQYLADRIESEWIELPRGNNGEVINIGDAVKETGSDGHLISDCRWNVVGVAKNTVYIVPHSGARNITHLASDLVQIHAPDPWERIEAGIADITNEATAQIVVRRCKRLAGADDD